MSESLVQVAPDSSGKKIQTFQNTVAGQVVQAQAVTLVDSSGNPNPTLMSTLVGVSGNEVEVDAENHLMVHIAEPVTAFGEISIAESTPVCQLDFIYGINTLLTTSTVTGSGTVTSATSLAICDTTAAASSSAQLTSKRYLKYRSGQGGLARFTALFTTGVAGSKQYAGISTSNLSDGYMFGYNGTTFGIWYNRGGTPSHIPQSTWLIDNMDGTGGAANPSGVLLDPTKGNVYQIKYQYLGFGAIFFYVENQNTGGFTPVHVVKFANLNTTPNVIQPSFNYLMRTENDGTTGTSIKVSGATAALFVEGPVKLLGVPYGRDNNKATITTETNILSIRNCTTYNGSANRAGIRPRIITFGANVGGVASGIATVKLVLNATLGGAPSFAATNGTTADNGVTITSGLSISSYDTAGTTVTGGTTIYNAIIALGSGSSLDITSLDYIIQPGDTLTISVTSTQSATVGVGLTWVEDL